MRSSVSSVQDVLHFIAHLSREGGRHLHVGGKLHLPSILEKHLHAEHGTDDQDLDLATLLDQDQLERKGRSVRVQTTSPARFIIGNPLSGTTPDPLDTLKGANVPAWLIPSHRAADPNSCKTWRTGVIPAVSGVVNVPHRWTDTTL